MVFSGNRGAKADAFFHADVEVIVAMKLLVSMLLLAGIYMSNYMVNLMIDSEVSLAESKFGFTGSVRDILELSQFAGFDAISGKPLFDPDREPARVVIEKKPVEKKKAARSLSVQALGIAVTGESLLAVVKDLRTGKIHRLRINDAVDGWTLTSVSADSFVFAKAGVEKTVKFKNN